MQACWASGELKSCRSNRHVVAIIFDQHPSNKLFSTNHPILSSYHIQSTYPTSYPSSQLAATSSSSYYNQTRMYIKRISLLVAIYGRGAFATLSASCEENEFACDKCTPIGQNYIPSGTGEMWYSDCCNESETDNASPPVTTTKKYCYSYKLKGYPNNLNYNIAPSCYGGDSPAWESKGQCSTTVSSIYFLFVISFTLNSYQFPYLIHIISLPFLFQLTDW